MKNHLLSERIHLETYSLYMKLIDMFYQQHHHQQRHTLLSAFLFTFFCTNQPLISASQKYEKYD